VLELPTRRPAGRAGAIILRPVHDGWLLLWGEPAPRTEQWQFGYFSIEEPALVSARALAARYGFELSIEERSA
jgi:hypothetical protein